MKQKVKTIIHEQDKHIKELENKLEKFKDMEKRLKDLEVVYEELFKVVD